MIQIVLNGEAKTLPAAMTCAGLIAHLSLTGKRVVNRIISNLGVLDVVEGGLRIVQLADGVTEAELRAATEATIVG